MGGAASVAVPEQIRFPDLLSLAPLLSQHTPGHTVNVDAMQMLFKKNRCAEGYMSRSKFLDLVRLFEEVPDLRRTILQRSADYKHSDVTIKKVLPPLDTIYRLRDDVQCKGLHFLNFDAFRNHGSYPCFTNPAIAKEGQAPLVLTTPANEINFETSYLIFVSHTWCTRESTQGDKSHVHTHPDTELNDQYKICLSGLTKFIQAHCKDFDNVFLWIDYSCLDLTPPNIEHTLNNISLYDIMHLCDCVFTPLVDSDVHWEFPSEMEYFYEDYNLAPWCVGPNAYMNRCWCRIEMFFGSNVPLLGDITAEEIEPFHAEHTRQFKIENGFPVDATSDTSCPPSPRPSADTITITSSNSLNTGNAAIDAQIAALLPQHMKMLEPKQPPPEVVYVHTPPPKPIFFSRRMRMSSRLRTRAFSEHRPHAIYSSYEYRFGLPPILVSPISNLYIEKYAPLAGYCSREDDRSIYLPSIDTDLTSPNGQSNHASPHESSHGTPKNGVISTSTSQPSFNTSTNNSHSNSMHALTSPYKSAIDLDRKHYHAERAVADRRQKRIIPAVLIRLNEEVHALITKGKIGYDGELNEDGERHGRGIYTYPNGESYVGEWEHGKRQGNGCFKHRNGDIFTGEFFQDREHGLATIQYANGDNYFGSVHNRKRSGHGLMEYANKDIYEGEFSNHLRHGEGVMKYSDGTIYTGMYEADRRHGMGVLSDAKKTVLYHGYWLKDHQAPDYLPPEGDALSPCSSQGNLSSLGSEHKHRHKHKHHHHQHHHHHRSEDGSESEHKHHHHRHHHKHSHSHDDAEKKAPDTPSTHTEHAHTSKTTTTITSTTTQESTDADLPALPVTKTKAELKEQIKHMHMKHSSAKLQTFQEIAEQHQNEIKAKPKKKIKKASAHHVTH